MPHPYRILVCARCDAVLDFGDWNDPARFSGRPPSRLGLLWGRYWNKLTEEK